MKYARITEIAVVLVLIVAAIAYIETHKAHMASNVPVMDIAATTTPEVSLSDTERIARKQAALEPAKEITTPDGVINTGGTPVMLADLVGKKVVLIDFWTYSCINCQRTLPYLEAWYEKYKDYGLEIVGIHTPEFEFEKVYGNVSAAVKSFGITFPVVLDNDFSTWQAYHNLYWPHKFLIDIDGYIAYDHVGEGAYEEAEQEIQAALKERSRVLGLDLAIPTGFVDPAHAIKRVDTRSPETYFGSARNEYLGNGMPGTNGTATYSLPRTPKVNMLYLGGTWDVAGEYARSVSATSTILYQYGAQKVYFVAGAPSPVRITVKKDGKVVKTITVEENKLYTLIDDDTIDIHTLELDIDGAGLEAFTFTFG